MRRALGLPESLDSARVLAGTAWTCPCRCSSWMLRVAGLLTSHVFCLRCLILFAARLRSALPAPLKDEQAHRRWWTYLPMCATSVQRNASALDTGTRLHRSRARRKDKHVHCTPWRRTPLAAATDVRPLVTTASRGGGQAWNAPRLSPWPDYEARCRPRRGPFRVLPGSWSWTSHPSVRRGRE